MKTKKKAKRIKKVFLYEAVVPFPYAEIYHVEASSIKEAYQIIARQETGDKCRCVGEASTTKRSAMKLREITK